GQIDAAFAGAAEFEDQRLFVIEAAIAGDGFEFTVVVRNAGGRASLLVHHASTFVSAAAKVSMSCGVVSSVAATIKRFATDLSCGSKREAGTPPSTCSLVSFSTTSAAGFGSLIVNSLKKAGV